MKRFALAATALLGFATSAGAQLVYSNDFDNPAFVAPGVVVSFPPNGLSQTTVEIAAAGPWNASGWSGNYLANRTGGVPQGTPGNISVLELTNLPAHTSVDIDFLLGFLESWDSTDGTVTPDYWTIYIDGIATGVLLTTNNASGTVELFAGGLELFEDVQINGNTFFDDTLVDMSPSGVLSFAHNSAILNIGFQANGGGWQGGDDEAWGIDNLRVTLNSVTSAVPEPATWTMMLLGFGLVGYAMRRRKPLPAQLA